MSNASGGEPPNVEPSSDSTENQNQNREGSRIARAGTWGRGNTRHSNRGKPGQDTHKFKGETVKMNGNVFQLHSERKNKSQFIDTIEALRVYYSSEYKSDIESLNVLLTNLETPSVKKPKEPEETVTFDRDGASISSISRFEEMTYSERIKQWIRDD